MKTFKQFLDESNLDHKIDSADKKIKHIVHKSAELGKQSFHAGMERPKLVAKRLGNVVKPAAKLGWNVLKTMTQKQRIVPYRPGTT